MPNGAKEKFRWGDSRQPPFSTSTWLRLDLTEQSPGLFDPQGKGFGVGSFPAGHPILPPNRLTRQGTPRRVSPPAGGERKSNHVLTGSAGQNILLTPRVPASLARVGVHPQFWEPSAAGPKIPAFPSPPSRWAGRYERWFMGRRPVSEHRKNLPLATNQREVSPGRREPLSALVFFPPAFFQRKPGSPAVVGGGNHVAGPTLRRSRRPLKRTGRCAPR